MRAGLGVLAGTRLAHGLWALLPELFWNWPWASHLPPYNEHLLRDFGGAGLALAVVLCAAVATMDRRLVLTALVAYLAPRSRTWSSTPSTWRPCRRRAARGSRPCWGCSPR
ncbi:hypothetical protein NGM37_51670, partial [Streptomyces sp. TRM76130]|nr:hypothetical protein [Streptomyces sp. TRM76130]